MLQFIRRCCSESNVAHKVQRYFKLFVASELVSDVLGFILSENSCGQCEQEDDLPATNLAHTASCEYLVEALHEEGNRNIKHLLATLVSRHLVLQHLGVLSERSERAREQRFIICGQNFVTHSKRRRARETRGTCLDPVGWPSLQDDDEF